MRTDLTISAIVHAALLLWCALSFSTAPLVAAAPDSLPVDIISDTQFSQLMKGNKAAPKAETPKPLVDKIEEPEPSETPAPKIAEKPEVKPIPKEAPPEVAPPEPKPEVKAEIKPEKKSPPKEDPIAEALKKEDAKRAAEAKKTAAAAKKKPQPAFNPDQIAALLDKRDPQRQAATGDAINREPTLGTATGSAATLSQSEIDALRARLAQLWNPPASAPNPQELVVRIRVKLGRDGKLAGPPMVLTSGQGSIFEAARDGAVRALFQAQPYEMLRPDHYDLWKEMEITFDPREMIPRVMNEPADEIDESYKVCKRMNEFVARGYPLDMSRRALLRSGGAAAVLASFAPRQAGAVVQIDVTQGNVKPLPIAIPDFLGSAADSEAARGLSQVIAADLQRSGLFIPIDPAAFIEKIADINAVPRFADWRVINASALAVGRVTRERGGFGVDFRLWDVPSSGYLGGRSYDGTPQNWRRIAHIIADQIYEKMTGEKGYFDSRVAFVDESGPKDRRVKRLAIMDQDGAGVTYLTRNDESVLTPRFSPSGREIVYTSYIQQSPRVMLMNIETRQREAVGKFPGMTFAPRFSPDGDRVVMSWQEGSNSHIFAVDLRSTAVAQLTNTPAIDTAPSYSPDGTRICFESDRGGAQQIYVMSASGGQAQRISYGDGRYATPVWSPRGDNIAFTKIGAGKFAIGIMRPDGSGERILTEGFHNEGPTFSPNGRVIMFFRDPSGNDGPGLWTVDITGRNEQRVPTPGYASDPTWSPLRT